jgi:hypothetical protein
MTVEIKNNKLCIEIDLEKPTPSSSGKTLVVASTRGNTVTSVEVDGKPVTIQRCPVRFLRVGLHPVFLGHGLAQASQIL